MSDRLEELMKNPAIRAVVLHSQMSEGHYKELEKWLPVPPMSDEMLAFMNERMGFADAPKDRDYRPYCCREGCEYMPRMMRVHQGFMCWSCKSVWDIEKQMKELKA